MTASPPRSARVRRVAPATISDEDVAAFARLANALRRERDTGEPPRSPQSYRDHFAGMAAYPDIRIGWWFAESGGELIGHAFVSAAEREDNRHLAHVDVEVLAPWRRRGVGRTLLVEAVRFAREHDRTLLLLGTSDRIPAGAEFATWLGARPGLRGHTNQLVLAELDRSLLARWQKAGEAAADFELGRWDGPYPEAELDAVAALSGVMNDQPRGEIDVEDEVTTPQRLRQQEAYLASRGVERSTLYLRHRGSGRLVGYTETYWDPHDPENLGQGDTGVLPEFRGRGLGKLLKAAMLERVLNERPEVKRVRTGNADANEAMLAINRALGFRPFIAHTDWQIETERAAARLAPESGS